MPSSFKYSKTSIRRNAFSNGAVPIWNADSDVTKLALSINYLKDLLDKDQNFCSISSTVC